MAAEDAFAGIEGQDEAVTLLRRAVAGGRVSHAYAFVGPSGSGRKLTAMAFARALVAPAGGPAAARIDRGAHPDVRLIQPTPPENNPKGPLALRIENVRALERLAALRPAESQWKVFIVDEAERMTVATPQAFLKTLEEPPARTVIVLILSQLRALPANGALPLRDRAVPAAPGRGRHRAPSRRSGAGAARRRCNRWPQSATRGWRGFWSSASRWGGTVRRPRLSSSRAGSGIATSSVPRPVQTRASWCSAAEADRPAGRRPLGEVLSGLTACREAWIALQGNVSPRLTVEVLSEPAVDAGGVR